MDSSRTNDGSNREPGNHDQTVGKQVSDFSRTAVRSIFPLLVCASLSAGWWIPVLYNWSGANQSYSPPIVGYVFHGFLIATAASLLAIPLLPKVERVEPVRNPVIQPFGFRVIAIILLMMELGLFLDRDAALVVIGMTSFFYPILCAIKLGILSPSIRWRIVSLYSCMYLPFAWVGGNENLLGAIKQGSLIVLPFIAGAPALLCYVYLDNFVGRAHGIGLSIAVIVAGLEILVGLWIIQLGARRALAYQMLLLAVSIVMSFCMYAMVRA